jgi:hypothetical protein
MYRRIGFSLPVRPWPLLAVLVCLGACSTAPPLNSDQIQARFGSYGVDVLESTDASRRSSLYSIENGERITRTYALVEFKIPADSPVYPLIAVPQAQIQAGASIGSTLRDAGWTIQKETLYVGALQLPDRYLQLWPLMRLDGNPALAMHAYTFKIRKGMHSIEYALIIELHHPDFLGPGELEKQYGVAPCCALGDTEIAALQEQLLAGLE